MKLYTIEENFVEDLRKNVDNRVPMSAGEKGTRPYIGFVMEIDDYKYYIPLSSPKPKHLTMKDSDDFIKIDGGNLGALNINNMIPILDSFLMEIDISINLSDDEDNKKYKKLLQNQKEWCNKNVNLGKIRNKAIGLYNTISKAAITISEMKLINKDTSRLEGLVKRCCDYKKLEEYIKNHYREQNI